MKKPRINNREASGFVKAMRPFENRGNTLFAGWENEGGLDPMYVVYSYGGHFPLFLYRKRAGIWYGNNDRYSQTTTMHRHYAHPGGRIEWLNTKEMIAMVNCSDDFIVAMTKRRLAA